MMEYVLQNNLYLPRRMPGKTDRPTCMDFFAGCGGFSLGFIQEGFEVVAAFEYEPNATLTYLHNLGSYPVKIHYVEPGDKDRLNKVCERQAKMEERAHQENNNKFDTKHGIYNDAHGSNLSGSGWIRHHPECAPVRNFWFGDVRKIKGKDVLDKLGMKQGELDVICGGPPCQGYSRANTKRNEMDPRNSLVFEFARMIIEIQPKTFVMEEVPTILEMYTPEGFPVIDELCRILSDGGFGTMDTIKKMLLRTSGMGAVLKSSGKVERKRKAKEVEDNEFEQVSIM